MEDDLYEFGGGDEPEAGVGDMGTTAQGMAQTVNVGLEKKDDVLIPPSTAARLAGDQVQARPMTAVSGAGFSSKPQQRIGGGPSGFGDAARGPAPPLLNKGDNSAEEQAKMLEKEVSNAVVESSMAASKGELQKALEKAKEAGRHERTLIKHREKYSLQDSANTDLQFVVLFNLAQTYEALEMQQEALNTYNQIVKNKDFTNSGRFRVNMGNIYYKQKQYPKAIKMYRMALDQVTNEASELRSKILRNIGCAFVAMGQLQDAIQAFETVMEHSPDIATGHNLCICYYALGEKDKMKSGFKKLVSVRIFGDATQSRDEDAEDADTPADSLRTLIRERRAIARDFILTISKLIAPILEADFVAGHDWVIEQIRQSPYPDLVNEVEIMKAITFLKNKDFDKAIETLKAFEKRDQALMAAASTNLSFIYFLQGDINASNRYATASNKANRYSAKAIVNKGNCLVIKGDLDRAATHYVTAISLEPECYEAIYNLGLVEKRRGDYDAALKAFEKLHRMEPDSGDVVWQIADLNEKLDRKSISVEWFNILATLVPTDPGLLARLGSSYASDDDHAMALQYYSESFRYFPVDLDVISWLGAYNVRQELYEKAIGFFKRAAEIEPTNSKWQLMAATCYRRMGAYQQALDTYRAVHRQFPESVECLRYLVRVCTDMGLKDEVQEYVASLRKLERVLEARQGAAAAQAEMSMMDEEEQADDAKMFGAAPVNHGDIEQQSAFKNQQAERNIQRDDPNFDHLDGGETGVVVEAKGEDDDWGDDEDVGELLPM